MRLPGRLTALRLGSLRLRLTIVFGAMFFLAAAVVLAATVVLVHRYWQNHSAITPFTKFDPPLTSRQKHELSTYLEQESQRQTEDGRGDALWMLKWGSPLVVGVGVAATGAGWVVAGRLLRPLTRIANTAERVAGRTLHQRIALDAPPGEVKSLADSFDRMLERLDESFAGQGRFIANAAHELKTPLVINRTLVEVAMNRPYAPAEVHHLGRHLLSVNVRHERLIDALLTLARSDNGEVERCPADLDRTAATVLQAAAPAAARKQVTLRSELLPAPVEGDPVLLEQLVRNLVDNAVRYNLPDGWVRIRTGEVPEGVHLTVSNSGPLVAAHEVPILFQPFRRLTDRVGSARGSGLGLSIVEAVARTHDGEALAIPHAEGGLTVTVTLPRRPSAGDRASAEPVEEVEDARP